MHLAVMNWMDKGRHTAESGQVQSACPWAESACADPSGLHACRSGRF